MGRQTTADNLADLVRIYGGTPSGDETTAKLLDMLEGLAPQGGTPSQEAIVAALEGWIQTHTGELTDDDIDEIFTEG